MAFFYKKLTPRKVEWPAYYRELLAVFHAVRHFVHILEAQHATVYIDQKPLCYTFEQRKEKLPPEQTNQLSYIVQYTADIQHISGSAKIVADALSKIDAISANVVAADDIVRAQVTDQELQDQEHRAISNGYW